MQLPLCKICGARHRLGPCPSLKARAASPKASPKAQDKPSEPKDAPAAKPGPMAKKLTTLPTERKAMLKALRELIETVVPKEDAPVIILRDRKKHNELSQKTMVTYRNKKKEAQPS